MTLDLTDQELEYTYRLYLTRPMGEVEALVNKVRSQVSAQTSVPPTPLNAFQGRPNGGEAEDLPALP